MLERRCAWCGEPLFRELGEEGPLCLACLTQPVEPELGHDHVPAIEPVVPGEEVLRAA